MNKLLFFKNFFAEDKRRIVIAIALIVGLLMIFIPSSKSKEADSSGESLSEYKSELEAELSELCSSIKGTGKCRVKVTFEEGESFEYRGSNLLSSRPPRVLGVAVVCQGADKDSVRGNIIECMTSLFDIGANRVSVLKMK